jgi:hypothetical protein
MHMERVQFLLAGGVSPEQHEGRCHFATDEVSVHDLAK